MRKQRVREIITKYGGGLAQSSADAAATIANGFSIQQVVGSQPSREQEDDARFVSKYFDTVANKQYQQLFCQYNQAMFAKVRGWMDGWAPKFISLRFFNNHNQSNSLMLYV